MNKIFSYLLLFFLLICFDFNGQVDDNLSNEQKVKKYLSLSKKLIKTDLEKTLFYLNEAKKLCFDSEDLQSKVELYNTLGEVYKLKGELSRALTCYLTSNKLINEKIRNKTGTNFLVLLKTDVYINIGSIFIQLKQLDKSLVYYENALDYLVSIQSKRKEKEIALRKLKIYNNIAAVYMNKSKFDIAIVYLKNSLKSNEIIKNPSIESSLLNNLGICYLEKNQNDLASHYFQKSLQQREITNDKKGQAQVLNNIGKNFIFQANFNEALINFKKALQISKELGNNESALISLQSLASVLDTLGNYKEALNYYKQFKSLNDSIFNFESKSLIYNLEKEFKNENNKQNLELKLQEINTKNLKSKITTIYIIFILFFLLIIALFLIFILRNKVKNSKLKEAKMLLEQEKLEFEQAILNENLELKEKELTTKALYLFKNNELIASITEKLVAANRQFSTEKQKVLQEIITELKFSQKTNVWEEFELYFTKVHSKFYDALQNKFPNLTSNEKKLCAFIRLNMSTKDISEITLQTTNSITVARTRLRKKLNIKGEDVHLVNFLMEI